MEREVKRESWRKELCPDYMEREGDSRSREPHPDNMEHQWEEAEEILSWREMLPGVYRYLGIEYCGENNYGRLISMITLETKEGVKMYYAPSSLYWNPKNYRSETRFIKHEGVHNSEKGFEYPVFKFAK